MYFVGGFLIEAKGDYMYLATRIFFQRESSAILFFFLFSFIFFVLFDLEFYSVAFTEYTK